MKNILRLFFVICLLLANSKCFSSDSTKLNDELILKIDIVMLEDEFYLMDKRMPTAFIDYQRNLSNVFAVGGYFGYGLYDELQVAKVDYEEGYSVNQTYVGVTNSVHYGLSGKVHLLSLFVKKPVFRFDLYSAIRIGGIYMNSENSENIIPVRGNYFVSSVMGGLTFFLTKQLGINTEVGYLYYKYRKGLNIQYGLSCRF